MSLPMVENLSWLQESIFNLSGGPQLHFREKSKKWSNFIKFIDFAPFPLFGVPWAAVIQTLWKLGASRWLKKMSEAPLQVILCAEVSAVILRNVIFLPVPWLVSAAVV